MTTPFFSLATCVARLRLRQRIILVGLLAMRAAAMAAEWPRQEVSLDGRWEFQRDEWRVGPPSAASTDASRTKTKDERVLHFDHVSGLDLENWFE